jgi:hypothetical protein
MSQRKVTNAIKKQVAGRQRFMCSANVKDYKCPLKGTPFDESGFHIDHIKELRDGGSNEIENLQALCLMCHTVKTNRRSSEVIKDKPKAPKKVKAPKVEEPPIPKKSYSFWDRGELKEFSDIDQMMKFADKLRADRKYNCFQLSGWDYEVKIPIGGRIIVQKELFPRFSDPAVRAGYNLGPWYEKSIKTES